MDREFVNRQAWKYVYQVNVRVVMAGSQGQRLLTQYVVSHVEMIEDDVIQSAIEDVRETSMIGVTDSASAVVDILNATVVRVRIRVDQ